jgi:catechol 2,3-dioxygenase-like lactoylglutathione lyase family enzyme
VPEKQPFVECEQLHPGLAVPDLSAAMDFYVNRLGFRHAFSYGDPPDFAGMNLGGVQIFLQTGKPTPGPDASAAYFIVGNADSLYEFQRANGVEMVVEIADRPYELRDYTIRDLNGYLLTFGSYSYKAGEKVSIERVDVPVRLEKRLAALLADLAARKRMTLGECLEEILLHTNDGVGPHTKTDLRFIEELKKKHGIEYDTHASYRFIEKDVGEKDAS